MRRYSVGIVIRVLRRVGRVVWFACVMSVLRQNGKKLCLKAQRKERAKMAYKRQPELVVDGSVWSHMKYMVQTCSGEMTGFGVGTKDDPLHVIAFKVLKQRCSAASCEFDDAAVAEYWAEQHKLGRSPREFARVWVHSHPGNMLEPSGTDWENMRNTFGKCDWAVMLILSKDGGHKAWVQFGGEGPNGVIEADVRVDWTQGWGDETGKRWKEDQEKVKGITNIVSQCGLSRSGYYQYGGQMQSRFQTGFGLEPGGELYEMDGYDRHVVRGNSQVEEEIELEDGLEGWEAVVQGWYWGLDDEDRALVRAEMMAIDEQLGGREDADVPDELELDMGGVS